MKNKRMEKIRFKLKCIYLVKILMVLVLLAVFGITLWLVNELLEFNIIYIVLSCFITMPIPIVLYNVVRGGYDTTFVEYMALYNHFVVKEAVKYNTETTIEFKENSFSDLKEMEKIGFVDGGTHIGYGSMFVGEYKDKTFEGVMAHTFTSIKQDYYVRRLIRRMLPRIFTFILRVDYINNYMGLIGTFSNIKFGKDPIVIYDKGYKNKKFIYEFDENCVVTTGNEEFDKQFVVKSANVEGARKYLTDDIMNALIRFRKLGVNVGIHLYLNNMSYSIKAKDFGFKVPVFRKLDINNEIEKVRVILRDYYKELLVFAK